MVGNADWEQKFATVIAGNDLPDILQTRVVANFPQLLEKRFTRLDEFLGGDAIKEYPNLANIPTRHWKSTVYNGAIYGIPIPRGVDRRLPLHPAGPVRGGRALAEAEGLRRVAGDGQGADRPEGSGGGRSA